MKILDNVSSIYHFGKTVKVRDEEEKRKKEEAHERLINREKAIQKEEQQSILIFNKHMKEVKKYLDKNDYAALNKYLRLLSYQIVFAETNRALSLEDREFVNIDNEFDILDEVLEKYNRFYSDDNNKLKSNWYIFTSSQEEFEHIKKLNFAEPLSLPMPTFNLRDRPILLNPWNNQRIADNMSSINSQNLLHPDININNNFLYPLDIMFCNGGNHSQLSALLDNNVGHESMIKDLYDLTSLYSNIEFNGYNFKTIDTKENILSVRNPVHVTIGIFYEVGRLLLEYPNYFPSNILEIIRKF